MEYSYVQFLVLAFAIITISFLGIILNRSNIIMTFISIEMMLLGINFLFIIHSHFLEDIMGQVYSLLFLTIGAAESAIGLGLLILFFKVRKDIFVYSAMLRH